MTASQSSRYSPDDIENADEIPNRSRYIW